MKGAYLACIPNMIVMAPSNEAELIHMVATSVAIDYGPSAVRYPRGVGLGLDLAEHGIGPDMKGTPLEVGKGVVRREGSDVALVGLGTMVSSCRSRRATAARSRAWRRRPRGTAGRRCGGRG